MPVMSSHLPNPGPSAQSFIRFRLLDGSPMSGLSPWAVEDAFVGAVGRCLSARPLRGGDLLVRCDPGERQQLLAITRVAGAEEGHDSPSCSSPSVCCAGCGDEHPSTDPGCPRWLAECQVSLLIRQGWEPRDARHYVATHPDADPTIIPSNSDSVRRPPPNNHSEYPPLPQKPNYIPPRPPTPRYPPSSGRSTPNAPPPPPPRPASAARSPAVPPRPPRAAGADSHGTPAPPPPPRERPAPPASQPKETDKSQAPVRSGLSNSDSNLTDSNTTTDHSSTPSPTTPPGRPRRTRLQSAPAESHTYTLRQKH
ncbi:formin-like protein 3 [Amphibalanus amphitrite]|uniref:formin-like protein 3 n=1 Tax=Amphibalanus amphitrite TaxID=1232801 RepID=UPI001C91C269|nr:formin-like protein 3 [Amphibalanus amphitrite]